MMYKTFVVRSSIFTAMAFLAATFVYPLFFMFYNSLKSKKEYLLNQFSMPENWFFLNNYRVVFLDFNILNNLMVSLTIALTSTALITFFGVFAGYAFSKLQFRGKAIVYVLVLATIFMPGQVSMIPAYVMFSKLNLMNNLWSVILSYLAGGLPAAILLLTAGFTGISNELIESAKMEGGGYFTIVGRIIVPLGMPSIVISIIFNVINFWNDLLTPMLYLSDVSKQTVMVVLSGLMSRGSAQPTFQLAGLLISVAPVVLIYIFLQRHLVKGLTEGAIK